MKFLIVTHVPHIVAQNRFFAYAPYVNEMNIWSKYVAELIIVAPLSSSSITPIAAAYEQLNITFIPIENFDILSLKNSIEAVTKFPKICWELYKAMDEADHIHLRCPGNIGLLGCLVQILFPNKIKTAKYAGNWDPNSKQPWTYRLQTQILSSTFWSQKMQVLVYGDWKNATANVKSFFTATYSEKEIKPLSLFDKQDRFQFVFVGALVKGKNPLYAIQLIEKLVAKGHAVSLKLYGEGIERQTLENYISSQKLENYISLEGNKNKETIKEAYQESHFVMLPSASEGWPKAIAEGMFWGCVPIATAVSCVPFMLDYGGRGILIEMDLENDCTAIENVLTDSIALVEKREKAANWSQQYTLERFENEIKKLLLP
ncbi:glycosyltransferase family 4 protein [Flavobacterium algicola]|uniref:glycosyltransferase family 4 protein n=1 Tax=Flavobacterium algicola TaxID=556529 RepID=UPI001EFE58B6|nr:glycosyltransferase family 4 protein [Flavobacterium algicola]MCG9793878.1 glycosyltransferase family 4 protein [Flavobacterium algicola]